MSTLRVPQPLPPVADDCEQLRKAFAGWGTNEGLIISILAHRNAGQRKLIRETYAETYGEDLLKVLDKELTNDFERLVQLWTLDPAERDAILANEATKKRTSSNQVLVEIACTRSSEQLLFVRKAYHALYKKSLEEDVAHHTTGDFRKLLLPLVSSYRYEGDEVNLTLAKTEAKLLHEKISEKAYNDDDLIRILATRSRAQINATLNHYKDGFGKDINKDLIRVYDTRGKQKPIISVDLGQTAFNEYAENGRFMSVASTGDSGHCVVVGSNVGQVIAIDLRLAVKVQPKKKLQPKTFKVLGGFKGARGASIKDIAIVPALNVPKLSTEEEDSRGIVSSSDGYKVISCCLDRYLRIHSFNRVSRHLEKHAYMKTKPYCCAPVFVST